MLYNFFIKLCCVIFNHKDINLNWCHKYILTKIKLNSLKNNNNNKDRTKESCAYYDTHISAKEHETPQEDKQLLKNLQLFL